MRWQIGVISSLREHKEDTRLKAMLFMVRQDIEDILTCQAARRGLRGEGIVDGAGQMWVALTMHSTTDSRESSHMAAKQGGHAPALCSAALVVRVVIAESGRTSRAAPKPPSVLPRQPSAIAVANADFFDRP